MVRPSTDVWPKAGVLSSAVRGRGGEAAAQHLQLLLRRVQCPRRGGGGRGGAGGAQRGPPLPARRVPRCPLPPLLLHLRKQCRQLVEAATHLHLPERFLPVQQFFLQTLSIWRNWSRRIKA